MVQFNAFELLRDLYLVFTYITLLFMKKNLIPYYLQFLWLIKKLDVICVQIILGTSSKLCEIDKAQNSGIKNNP